MVFKNVNPTKFVDELVQKNIEIIEAFYNEEDNTTSITFTENTDLVLVNNLYLNHNPIQEEKLTIEEKINLLEKENAEFLIDLDYRISKIELGV